MHKTVLAAMISVLLAGCSLPVALTPNSPTISERSAKSPDDYSDCVMSHWQKQHAQVDRKVISRGYEVRVSGSMTASDYLEVHRQGEGSLISFYEGAPWHRSAKRAVYECL
uniref:hypothetical protein n=1 Tax=Pseudomonas laurentiana TaxID=2364649 RepID=UPI0029C698C5|nr:hypothetical protein [Pseudomonas laurentiana]